MCVCVHICALKSLLFLVIIPGLAGALVSGATILVIMQCLTEHASIIDFVWLTKSKSSSLTTVIKDRKCNLDQNKISQIESFF